MKCIDLIARCIDDKLQVSNNIKNEIGKKSVLSRTYVLDIWWFYELFFQCTILGNPKNFEWWLLVIRFFSVLHQSSLHAAAAVVVVSCMFVSFVCVYVGVAFFFVSLFQVSVVFHTVCLSIFVQKHSRRSALNLVHSSQSVCIEALARSIRGERERASFEMSQIIKRIDQHQIHWYYVYFDVYNTDAVCSKFFYVLFF